MQVVYALGVAVLLHVLLINDLLFVLQSCINVITMFSIAYSH